VVESGARVVHGGALGGLKILAAAGRRFRSRAKFLTRRPGNVGLSRCPRRFLPPDRLKRRSRLLASLTVDRRTAGRSYGLHGARSRSETDVSQRRQRQRSQKQGAARDMRPPSFRSSAVFATPRHQQLAAPQHPGRGMAPWFCRGRDRHCWRPPAQIPACGTTALGSCLRFWRQSEPPARDARCVLLVAIAFQGAPSVPRSSRHAGCDAAAS
jgi:hypothetical protein